MPVSSQPNAAWRRQQWKSQNLLVIVVDPAGATTLYAMFKIAHYEPRLPVRFAPEIYKTRFIDTIEESVPLLHYKDD